MRMTISVPDPLKERMTALKQKPNWSALACRAFTAHLAQVEGKKEKRDMDAVIARLRDSRLESAEATQADGFSAGQTWASGLATADQLQRLAEARDPVHGWYVGVGSSAYGAGEQVYFLIEPEDDGDRSAAEEFWKNALDGDDMPDDDSFVQGFAEGACAIWYEVSDQL